jgi:uncharacterized protein (DUF433 family)
MTHFSDRQHDDFDNPAKMACRAGNLRALREAGYRHCRRRSKINRTMEARPMIDWRQFLTSDPQVCHGQLCAKGTRVFVTNILDSLAEGASRDEILKSYPSLRPEHIDAAVAYAAELAREESLLPMAGL